MDNFKAVYQILSVLEQAMDYQEFDTTEALGVSQERWSRYIEMMLDVGYIKGAEVKTYIGGNTVVDLKNIRITLYGLEYLQKNFLMRKMYRLAKGIKETVPYL